MWPMNLSVIVLRVCRYNRQMQVREGFDTSFVFRVSNPSVTCTYMDDVYTNCRCVLRSWSDESLCQIEGRSRGGEGFAFVIQNMHGWMDCCVACHL